MKTIELHPEQKYKVKDRIKLQSFIETLKQIRFPELDSVDGNIVLEGIKENIEQTIETAENDIYEYL